MTMMDSVLSKLYRKSPVLIFDALAIPVAWYLAFWFRYNLKPFSHSMYSIDVFKSMLVLFVIQQSCNFFFKIYRGLWQFFSLNDVIRIIKSVSFAIFLVIPCLYLTYLLQHVPRSVLPAYAIILIALLCGGRLVLRLHWDKVTQGELSEKPERVLIVGAGNAGESLVRDLKRDSKYLPVGLVDDKLGQLGMEVHGIRVLGAIQDLPSLIKAFNVDLIFIAIPSASSSLMRTIVTHCEQSGVTFRTLPSISALVSGRVEVNALRPVNIEDLLGRAQVHLEWNKIAGNISKKRILVTGAGGSIGSELCRQIMQLHPEQLILIENSEFGLYQIHQELSRTFPHISLHALLVNVVDEVAIKRVFKTLKPQIVFHAAAYKHVPMLENQIRVAVSNNVIGTQIVAQASVYAGVEKFILISTDKAVNPTNIMGTTKRVAEIYCQNINDRVKTQFITVRFGNVLGSTGSVVPLFKNQLQEGGPITVTHPEIERYFMTIPEASQLILQAMVNGLGGEIFVLDMGEPIKIRYLAEQMIRLAGKEPGKDITIEYTGLRPGEKLFEELFHDSEQLQKTEHEKLFKAKFRKINWEELTQTIHMLGVACNEYEEDELRILLKSLVPESKITMNVYQSILEMDQSSHHIQELNTTLKGVGKN
jgi:FlaA1/EpsC-like NDP-sugar epimerase